MDDQYDLIDAKRLSNARMRLGPRFWDNLRYLHDEGHAAISAIETSLRAHDPVGMIEPAERLKDEAQSLGALALAAIAERIEAEARDCVEWHQDPGLMIEPVVMLRSVFAETIDALRKDSNPLISRTPARRPVFMPILTLA